MATTILATAGRAVAGPWGAALGALAGRAVERASNTPLVDDLPITSSAYGAAIPRVFGIVRLAGNLIWSTPVRASEVGKGGAGRGAVASFALILCQAPVARIGRIWADGALLRDVDGRQSRRFTIREHLCGRPVADPLIAAAHPEGAPAYAGLCHVVWENLDLAPFGDRIPNLLFEVVGDGADAGPAGWARTLLRCGGTAPGLPATGMIAAGRWKDDGALAAMVAGLRPATGAQGILLAADGFAIDVSAGDATAEGRARFALGGGGADSVEVAYNDPARDHQRGVQRAGSGTGRQVVEVPAALDAPVAAKLAARLSSEARDARTMTVTLPWRWLSVQPGDVLRIDGGPRWRVLQRTITGLCVELRCVALQDGAGAAAWDAGGALPVGLQPVPPHASP